ncbi:MAG: aldehyde ferredoxin oxidoreductase [Deltaproteobacteria bacterium]|nr:MAG: aldehyde ferredoxin oxidoreductase [Deltaproteobacteria bacterium]
MLTKQSEVHMTSGVTGKYCIIDLGSQTIEVVAPGDDFYRKYLSGYGLGAAVIMERQKPGIDPLAPESHLGFCTGLLTDTGAYFSGRFMVVGKSPLTGGWGDANAGGYFSRALKRSGYDAVFFTGQSLEPVWVSITPETIEFNDAGELWGMDIPETEKTIKSRLKSGKVQVASIGISGEKRSLISGIATDGARIAARSGLGAVMGSKRLKAIAVRGRKRVSPAEPERIRAINRAFMKDFKKSNPADRITIRIMNPMSRLIARTGISVPARPSLIKEVFKRYGTSGLTAYSGMIGDMPVKNWNGAGITDYSYESAKKNSDEKIIAYQKRKYACQSCPMGCGGIIDIKKGRFAGTRGHKPEYETLGAFGGLLLNDELDAIIEMNEMCNRAGIDTISTGTCVAFAIECFENGIISEKDTGGLRLGWGRTAEIMELTEMIIQRKGIGDVLADGVRKAAEKIGKGSEQFAVHAGGQELPMHDSRLDPGFAIAYQCEPTPGRHTISCYLYAGLFGVKKNFPGARKMIRRAKGKLTRQVTMYTAGSFYMQLVNCCGLCLFGAMASPLPVVEYMNAATGWDLTPDEYLGIGERILNLRKAFNMREGITVADHKLSGRAIGRPSLAGGPLRGVTIDMEKLETEFYAVAGWDLEKGGPTAEKLKELEIDNLV